MMMKILLLFLCLGNIQWCHTAPASAGCTLGMVYCFVSPCQVTHCPSHPRATCVDDYCGGCNAHFYENGRQLLDVECRSVAS